MPKKTAPTNHHEHRLRKAGHKHIAGVDEAGKGSWAGPLVAAAVILDTENIPENIFDSKMLSPQQREKAFVSITKKSIAWSVSVVPAKMIDRLGIQKANYFALQQATKKLRVEPDVVLVDAYRIDLGNTPTVSIISGDAKERNIGAASIVAKVVRDRLMSSEIHRAHPQYHFHVHKGYGTPLHQKLLDMYGPSPEHRFSFAPVKQALTKTSKKKKTVKKTTKPKRKKSIAKKSKVKLASTKKTSRRPLPSSARRAKRR
jgi:ribonuclease HII